MAGPKILRDLDIGLSTKGILSNEVYNQRFLDSDETFELSNYLTFEVRRGDEDSADIEDLSFNVKSIKVENDMLHFKLIFE